MSFHGVPFFQDILNSFQETQDLHAMLNASGELLNMVLFGVLRRTVEPKSGRRKHNKKAPVSDRGLFYSDRSPC